MDAIITADTSTYHISDAFMIPTITIFTDSDYLKKIKYYKYVKPIFIEDKSKNLSKFFTIHSRKSTHTSKVYSSSSSE